MSATKLAFLFVAGLLTLTLWMVALLLTQHDEGAEGQYVLNKSEWDCVHYYIQPIGMAMGQNCDEYRMKGH